MSSPIIIHAQAFLARVSAMLEEKNRAYGDSAGSPIRIFSRASVEEGLRVRIDDKLSREARGDGSGGEDVIFDLVGYFAMLAGHRACEAERLQNVDNPEKVQTVCNREE